MALGLTQPLTNMSIRNLRGGKARPTLKVASQQSVRRLFTKCGILDVPQSYRHTWPITGMAVLLLYFSIVIQSSVQFLQIKILNINDRMSNWTSHIGKK
jgi:hypothetical protein